MVGTVGIVVWLECDTRVQVSWTCVALSVYGRISKYGARSGNAVRLSCISAFDYLDACFAVHQQSLPITSRSLLRYIRLPVIAFRET